MDIITIYTPYHDGGGYSDTKAITFEEFRIYFGYHPMSVDQDRMLMDLGWNKWDLRSANWFPIGQSKEQLDALYLKVDEANRKFYELDISVSS